MYPGLKRHWIPFRLNGLIVLKTPRHLCPGNGYSGEPALEIVVLRGVHSPYQGSRAGTNGKAEQYRVSGAPVDSGSPYSRMNRFHKILVRFEKLESSYLGLLMFACAFIAFRKALII
jgi:hypothetical protein